MSSQKTSKTLPAKKPVFSPFKLMVERMGEHLGIPRMNMREVGAELGVSTSGVSDFNKKDYIPPETMMRWCTTNQVSVDWLLQNQKTETDLATSDGEEIMYRFKYEKAQDRIIELLEENASLKVDLKLKKGPLNKKASGE